jgi:ferritin-like metal-binding protein YciE
MAELQARDAKLIQYLNESYGKEKELETSLQAHIAMASRDAYKKRLKEHLKETKDHARQLQKRIKALGGKAEVNPEGGRVTEAVSEAAAAVQTGAKKAVAAAQGPVHALRGLSEAEKQLKNAKTEYSEEHEEIANYNAIETLAEALGDDETAKLARAIRRDEERMAKFLDKQIATLTKEVVRSEIPSDQRSTSRRRSSSSSRRSSSSRSRSGSSSSSRGSSSRRKASSSRS